MLATVPQELVRGLSVSCTAFIIVFTSVVIYYTSRDDYVPPEVPKLWPALLFFSGYFILLVANVLGIIERYNADEPITYRTWMTVIAMVMMSVAVGYATVFELSRWRKRKDDDND